MAWLEKNPSSGHFKICFRWGGRRLKKTIKTDGRKSAETTIARFEENMLLLERGRLELPPSADVATFLLSDGKLSTQPSAILAPKPITLADLRDAYLEVHANGAMESNSLATVRIHFRHLVATLGELFQIGRLTTADL